MAFPDGPQYLACGLLWAVKVTITIYWVLHMLKRNIDYHCSAILLNIDCLDNFDVSARETVVVVAEVY